MAARRSHRRPRGIIDPAAHGQKISLDLYDPSPQLARLVEYYWAVSWDLPDGEVYRAENLPHPSVHVVFEPAGSYVQGVHTDRFVYTARGSGRAFAAKFRPGGFYPWYRRPVSHLTDRRVSLDDALGPGARGLAAAVAACGEVGERIRVMEEFLLARARVFDPRAAFVAEIIEHIGIGAEVRRVAALEERFGLGRRALEALFARYVGVGPKWVIRRARMLEALERLNTGQVVDAGLLALDLGYSDQAHFIKDFKAMTGRTPGRYLRAVRGGPRAGGTARDGAPISRGPRHGRPPVA
jgi:AraC-like DNA-binding protein